MDLRVVAFFLLVGFGMSQAERPRGVRPDMAGFYDAADEFHCLDGSNTIPFDMVNDDYCDCTDGSDEPGTSACSNGRFYCANKGFKPSLVMASRVNDGICDCCDGSDEWASENPCKNNCEEMGAAEKIERERLAKVIEEGLQKRNEMAQQGLKMKSEKETELANKKAELDGLATERDAKRVVKDDAEAKEKEALDVIREEEDRKRAEKEEQERLEREQEAEDYFRKFDANSDGQVTKEELMVEHRFDQNNDGFVNDEEANFYMSGHESYDRDSFVNSGWLLMKHQLSQYEKNEKPIGEVPEVGEDGEDEHGEIDDYDYDDHDLDDEEHEPTDAPPHHGDDVAEAPADEGRPLSDSQYSPEVQALVDTATVARDEYNAADRAYSDVQRDIENLEKHLTKDYGVDQVFEPMANECFEFKDLEYVYKMCAFDYCSQKPIHGGSDTRLGNWEQWSVPHTQMSYERGVTCWNGPARSTKVDLRCGASNALVAASEPNRCEYLFVFETPAVCEPLPPLNHDHDEL